MVLEATMVCVDNSEYMRNGDYPPSRLDAQSDAVNLICSAKIQQNPENVVGILTSAGNSSRILETSTQDIGRILQSLHMVRMEGKIDLIMALQKAQLALKHRENQNQKPRIVAFVGSPVEASEEELVKLAKKLKKNGVAVDIVSFGEHEANAGKLQAFIDNINSNENSHLVTVPPGAYIMSDVLLSSAIITDSTSVAAASGSGGGVTNPSEFPFGVDPAADPELAMALRISMEEEQARIAAQQRAAGGGGDAAAADAAPAVPSEATPAVPEADVLAGEAGDAELYGSTGGGMDVDEDEEMRLAIEMSLAEERERKAREEGAKDNEEKKDGQGQ